MRIAGSPSGPDQWGLLPYRLVRQSWPSLLAQQDTTFSPRAARHPPVGSDTHDAERSTPRSAWPRTDTSRSRWGQGRTGEGQRTRTRKRPDQCCITSAPRVSVPSSPRSVRLEAAHLGGCSESARSPPSLGTSIPASKGQAAHMALKGMGTGADVHVVLSRRCHGGSLVGAWTTSAAARA